MRILADMGCSPRMVRKLRDEGHDVIDLREHGLERLPDEDILRKARDENRVVLTFDLDFGTLLAQAATAGPSVVLFRLGTTTTAVLLDRITEVLNQESKTLQQGAIIVVEKFRLRIRQLPIHTPGDET